MRKPFSADTQRHKNALKLILFCAFDNDKTARIGFLKVCTTFRKQIICRFVGIIDLQERLFFCSPGLEIIDLSAELGLHIFGDVDRTIFRLADEFFAMMSEMNEEDIF